MYFWNTLLLKALPRTKSQPNISCAQLVVNKWKCILAYLKKHENVFWFAKVQCYVKCSFGSKTQQNRCIGLILDKPLIAQFDFTSWTELWTILLKDLVCLHIQVFHSLESDRKHAMITLAMDTLINLINIFWHINLISKCDNNLYG